MGVVVGSADDQGEGSIDGDLERKRSQREKRGLSRIKSALQKGQSKS
jgi:hypothetical protein